MDHRNQRFVVLNILLLSIVVIYGVDEHFTYSYTEVSEEPQYGVQWIKSDDPGMRPNISQRFDGTVDNLPITYVDINSHGFRDEEYSQKKPEDVYRIGIVGDSYAFGWGVNRSNRFSEVLQRELESEKKEIQVLNFGVPDSTTNEQVDGFEERWQSFELDHVVLAYTYNSIMDREEVDRIEKEIQEGNETYLEQGNESYHVYWAMFPEKDFSKQRENLEQPLSRLHKLSNENEFGVTIYHFTQYFGQAQPEKQDKLLLEIKEDYNWTYIDSDPLYDKYSHNELHLTSIDPHPTELYHEEVGKQIYHNINWRKCLSRGC